MEFALEYHMLFMFMTFILLILSVLLLFMEVTLEKAIASNIFIMINIVFCLIVSLGFSAIDFYSYDTDGILVHNVSASMYPFTPVYFMIIYINIMLLIYSTYLYIKKPWEQFEEENPGYMNY